MKFLSWIFTLPIAIVSIAFAIGNRHLVRVNFDPLPFVFDVRLAVVVLVAFAVGTTTGAVLTWFSGRQTRRGMRISQRETKRLIKERNELTEQGSKSTFDDLSSPTR